MNETSSCSPETRRISKTPRARPSAFRDSIGTIGFAAGKTWRCVSKLPAAGLLQVIRIYQRLLSPVLPALLGPNCGCRFAPSCSEYAAEAIVTFGALRGGWLAARRLAKCGPWHEGGFNPLPAAVSRRHCVRVPARSYRFTL